MPKSTQGSSDPNHSLWIALAALTALVIGAAAGVLGWLSGQTIAGAVLTGGVALGGTLTLAVLIINSFRGR